MSDLPVWFLPSIVGLFGLLFGSFLNVVIYRVPAGESLMGRSNCPRCGHQIRSWDNIPVLSWLLLRGRCRDCAGPISWRYPAIEAAHAAAWTGLALWQGWSPLLPLLLYFASVSIALTAIDFDTMRLPDAIVYPTLAVVGVYLTVLGLTSGDTSALKNAAIGAGAYLAFFLLMFIATRGRGLGFGDVKLAPVLGAMTGWFSLGSVGVGAFAAFAIGGIPAAVLLLTGVLKRGTAIPFGPALIAGAWVGILWGEQIVAAYLSLFGLG